MIIINIEIENPNRIKEFSQKLHSKSEDLMFSIIMKLPEKFVPSALMEWLDRYTSKRIRQLEMQNVKQTWRNTLLQDAVDEIHNRQQV